MTCSEFAPLISRLLDNELSGTERLRVEQHLETCGECRTTRNAWRAHGLALRAFFARHAVSDPFVAKVRLGVGAFAPPRRTLRLGPAAWLAAAALLLAGIFVAYRLVPSNDIGSM